MRTTSSFLALILLSVLQPVRVAAQTSLPVQSKVVFAPAQQLEFRVDLRTVVPSSVTVEEGTYRIRIVSGVYVVPLDFSLNAAASLAAVSVATKVAAVQTSVYGQRAKLETDLHPGNYILTVTGHPELTSTLTVTAKAQSK